MQWCCNVLGCPHSHTFHLWPTLHSQPQQLKEDHSTQHHGHSTPSPGHACNSASQPLIDEAIILPSTLKYAPRTGCTRYLTCAANTLNRNSKPNLFWDTSAVSGLPPFTPLVGCTILAMNMLLLGSSLFHAILRSSPADMHLG